MPNTRQQLTAEDLATAVVVVREKLAYRAEQKGLGVMASSHEILGILLEEMTEYEDSVHMNLSDADKVEELKDIAVGALFGIASIQSGGVDW